MRFFRFLPLLLLAACGNDDTPQGGEATNSVPQLSHSVTAVYPHDTTSFIQGLTFYRGQLFEGTGQYGQSKLLKVELETGLATQSRTLDPKYFGEGIAVLSDTLYQLTWQERTVFLYDPATLQTLGTRPINTEGWGITTDGRQLIVTDGSSNLYFYEPGTMRLLRTQGVTEGGSPAVNLNELEFINGYVYANQWQYNYILKIDPQSGQVVGKLNLSALDAQVKGLYRGAEFMNGIAYNEATGKIYVTGKNWPQLYEIDFQH